MELDARSIFRRRRKNLPSPYFPATEAKRALRQVYEELEAEYNLAMSCHMKVQVICDLSSNNLSLDHLTQLSDWLQGSSLELYALDLSMNRIFCNDWAPILALVEKLLQHTKLLILGGNYLPVLMETAELKNCQDTRRVSLALPMSGGPVSPWMREWSSIAMDFDCQAYDPVNNYGEIKMLP